MGAVFHRQVREFVGFCLDPLDSDDGDERLDRLLLLSDDALLTDEALLPLD